MIRKDWDSYFFDIARMVATRSTCNKRHVGAVIVWNCKGTEAGHIIATGYNGAASGEPHCIDIGCDLQDGKCIRTIHAEMNALEHVKWHCDFSDKELTLYSTTRPCSKCSGFICENFPHIKIKYLEDYR